MKVMTRGDPHPILMATAGVDIPVRDSGRCRDIPTHIFCHQASAVAPVILLSPGLGGTHVNYSYLSEHWAARGYVVLSIQRPGSDDSVWKGKPPGPVAVSNSEDRRDRPLR